MSKTVGGVTTKFLIDTLNPTGYSHVRDELVSGAVTKTYTYGQRPISEEPALRQHVDADLLRPRAC